MPRNKKILDILYRSKNVEIQWSGLRKVLDLCKLNNVSYTYYNNEYGFRFSFYRKNVFSNFNTMLTKPKLNKTDLEVLKHLKNNPEYTREEISLNINKTVRTVQRSLDKLKDCNKVIRVGNNSNGYWKILE